MLYYINIKREIRSRETGDAIMEHFELVEKLVNTFGVSYEKAKEALESSNWDAIDAAIYLEKEKNSEPQPVKQEIPEEPKQEEPVQEEPKQEEPKQEEPKESNEPSGVNTGTKGSTFNRNTKSVMDDLREEGGKFFKTIWDFLSLNSFVVKKASGEVFLDIPIWLMALLLCAFFWAVILILGIVFLMGYRFSFNGPQLGKKNIKNTVNHVETVTEDFVEKVKNSVAPDTVEPVEEEKHEPEIIIEPNPETKEEQAETTVSSEENSESSTENKE